MNFLEFYKLLLEEFRMLKVEDYWNMDENEVGLAVEFVKKHSPKFKGTPEMEIMRMFQRRGGTVGDVFNFVVERDGEIAGVLTMSRVAGWQVKKKEGMAVATLIVAKDQQAAEDMLKGILERRGSLYDGQFSMYVDLDNRPVLAAVKSLGVFDTKLEDGKVVVEYPQQMEDRPDMAKTGFDQRVDDPVGYYFGGED